MGWNTKIEWTDHTWNPWYGCPDDGRRSAACDHCYARSWAKRCGIVDFDQEIKRASRATFNAPLNRRKYKSGDRVFVCSLSDVCHGDVADEWVMEMWNIVRKRSDLIWIFLTKRPENLDAALRLSRGSRAYDPRPLATSDLPQNLWIGVTVETQELAEERIPELLRVPAAVRFVSCEPLLGRVNLRQWMTRDLYFIARCPKCGWFGSTEYATSDGESCECHKCYEEMEDICDSGLDWVIVGGESGPGARPMHPEWVRDLRDQCEEYPTAFLFKQWGNWDRLATVELAERTNHACLVYPDGEVSYSSDGVSTMHLDGNDGAAAMVRVRDKNYRVLDGATHDEYPGGNR